jgi:hypothetical protein
MESPKEFSDPFGNYTDIELKKLGKGYTAVYEDGMLICEELCLKVAAVAKTHQEIFLQSDEGNIKLTSGGETVRTKSILFLTEKHVKWLQEKGVFKPREWVPDEKM